MIETSFIASLKREEGREVTFSVVLLREEDKEAEQQSSGLKQEILTIGRRMPLTPDTLEKLSPACDPQISALVVSPPHRDFNDYEIWGLMFFGPTSNRFNEVPVGLGEFNTLRPDVLTVTAISPGSLMISRGNGQIGRFVLGAFVPAMPTPFVSRAMGDFIIASIQSNQGYEKYGVSYWHVYRDAVEYLLFEAARRGHGGIIIVVSKGHTAEYEKWFKARHTLGGRLRIEELIQGAVSSAKEPLLYIAYNRKLDERLKFLAQLVCVDGALLVSNELEPISFGVTLGAPEWQGQIVVGQDGFGSGSGFDLSRMGTRHNSTANFIGACAGCFGFVLSQDGPIRGFVKKDGSTLYCWPDCTTSMFV